MFGPRKCNAHGTYDCADCRAENHARQARRHDAIAQQEHASRLRRQETLDNARLQLASTLFVKLRDAHGPDAAAETAMAEAEWFLLRMEEGADRWRDTRNGHGEPE